MSTKLVICLTILACIITIPTVYAQISIGENATQKSVQVVISSSGEVHVKHIIAPTDSPKKLELINGTVTNITVSDEAGNEKQFGTMGNNEDILILPSQKHTIVEYDLDDVIFLKNNLWTWDFMYLETTSFITPEEADLIFVNNSPVYLSEKKGIACHGCKMILEYAINEPRILKKIKTDKEFLIEVRTFAEINQFNFDQQTKTINFEINGENQFITTIIPTELFPGPYNVFLNDEKILFHQYINNGTHIWLNIRPDSSGNVTITNTESSDKGQILEENLPITNSNQDQIMYIVIGIIVLVGIGVAIIFIKKRKSDTISSKIKEK